MRVQRRTHRKSLLRIDEVNISILEIPPNDLGEVIALVSCIMVLSTAQVASASNSH